MAEKSYDVFITTIGRNTLPRMLDSLINQLNTIDYLTIASDANHGYVAQCVAERKFKCNVNHLINPVPLGFFGHGSRNKYQNQLKGDYIMHADDDDRYVVGAFNKIREICTQHTLYFFRFCYTDKGDLSWWHKDDTKIRGNIGTPCGVIPNIHNFPQWGNFYTGDGLFYENLVKIIPHEYIDYVIYKTKNTK